MTTSAQSPTMLVEQNLQVTDVLLGFASQEVVDDDISQLGGHPTWLDDVGPPDADWIRCANCDNYMSLMLQLDAGLPKLFPKARRRLHIFMCKRYGCRGQTNSCRAIRSTTFNESQTRSNMSPPQRSQENLLTSEGAESPSLPGIGASLFKARGVSMPGSNDNPFRLNTEAQNQTRGAQSERHVVGYGKTQNPTSLNFDKLSIAPKSMEPRAQTKKMWPKLSELPEAWPKFYLDAEYECLELGAEQIPAVRTVDENATDINDQEEIFESSIDKTFQVFADRISQNPEQVIRYKFAGLPILYSTTDDIGKHLKPHLRNLEKTKPECWHLLPTGLPNCENCDSPRVFEVQITPHTITELEGDLTSLDGMDWGTIIIGVCKANCSSPANHLQGITFSLEWMGIQWEDVGTRT